MMNTKPSTKPFDTPMKAIFFAFTTLTLLLYSARSSVGGNEVPPAPTPQTYTVSFNTNGGNSLNTQTIEEGEMAKKPDDPTRDGYRFLNWYNNPDAPENDYDFDAEVRSNMTIYANWEKVFTVTFDAGQNGNLNRIQASQKTTDSMIADPAPTIPTRTGHRFVGWYGRNADGSLGGKYVFSTKLTKDTALIANWTPNQRAVAPPAESATFTVTFNTNGGSKVKSEEVNSGNPVPRPEAPTKRDSIFGDWYEDAGLTDVYDFSDPVLSDLTLYAGWLVEEAESSDETYEVTFNTNGGSELESEEVNSGDMVARPDNPDPPSAGLFLRGWFTDDKTFNNAYDFNATVEGDIDLYAKWEYMVTYDLATKTITGLNPDLPDGDIELVIPSNINGVMMDSIGYRAFYENTRIVSLRIAEGIKYIQGWAFALCSSIGHDLVIPNFVETIGFASFTGCSGFTGSLTIGNSVETIRASAFSGCSGFTGRLTLGNSIDTIEAGAFLDCRGFTGDLTIPSSVDAIGRRAFEEMINIATFIFKSSTPPHFIKENIFRDIPLSELNIRVPNEEGVVQAYRLKTNLTQYSMRIRATE